MQTLDVWYEGWGEKVLIGQLASARGIQLFEYTDEAIASGIELSPLNVKLRKEAYQGFPNHQHGLPGLIADSLPDGFGLLLMDRLFRTRGLRSATVSAIDRLAFLGSDTMGALTYAPSTESALAPSDVDLLNLARESRAALDEGASEDLLRHMIKMGGSPHGARPKSLVNYDPSTRHMANDAGGTGDPWLVKFPAPDEHKEVCEIELLYSVLAAAAHIEIPPCQSFDLGAEMSAFAIRRFDRAGKMRVPTHTVAGALNANFRTPGAVDYQTFLRLTKFITNDAREVLKAFDRCVFNVIFNNRDDHAKNFSYALDASHRWHLSPAYDLTYSYGYNGEHQMDVSGLGRDITRSALLTLAASTDLRASDAKASIDRICSVASEMPQIARQYQIRRQTISEILAQVNVNQRNMLP